MFYCSILERQPTYSQYPVICCAFCQGFKIIQMDRNTYRGRGFVRVQKFPERYEKTAFVYGDFHKDYDGSLYHYITKLPDLDNEFQTSFYNVESNTVTQCTVLKDKN